MASPAVSTAGRSPFGLPINWPATGQSIGIELRKTNYSHSPTRLRLSSNKRDYVSTINYVMRKRDRHKIKSTNIKDEQTKKIQLRIG